MTTETELHQTARILYALDQGGYYRDGYRALYAALPPNERRYWADRARTFLKMRKA